MKIAERLISRVSNWTRPAKQGVIVLTDTVFLAVGVWAAYSLRLGIFFVPSRAQLLLMMAAPLLAVPIFFKFNLYRSVVRYVGEHALWSIFQAMSVAALTWATLAFMTQMTGLEGVPRAIPVLYWMIGIVLISSSRFGARWLLWLPYRREYTGRRVLIYNAGASGRQLAASMQRGTDLMPAGFIDDDPRLVGKDISGLRVYGRNELDMLIERFDVHDIIVTLPSISHTDRKEIVSFLEEYPVKVRVLPALADIASGKHIVNMLREVDIGDLLGRESVAADPALLGKCITGKTVLVSGAGGSIGRELCLQVTAQLPSKLILLESSEYGLYQVDRALREIAAFPVVACLGSITNESLIRKVMVEHSVQTIYHAAAHKHVPIVEANVLEGTRNNVFGTKLLARTALDAGVESFILISSDKAVRPTNVMGATKRWAELIVQDCDRIARTRRTGQRFCAVRFGNVLGSSGSVIPLFREQIAQGGPVTVTHTEVTRYFMSIHEAVELVIQAGSMAVGGEIFLLDMGEPVRIVELAHNMIRLAGYKVKDITNPDGDIEIEVTGLRPGEKLYEELLIGNENATITQHPKIMKALEPGLDHDDLSQLLVQLQQNIDCLDADEVRHTLMATAIGHIDVTPRLGVS